MPQTIALTPNSVGTPGIPSVPVSRWAARRLNGGISSKDKAKMQQAKRAGLSRLFPTLHTRQPLEDTTNISAARIASMQRQEETLSGKKSKQQMEEERQEMERERIRSNARHSLGFTTQGRPPSRHWAGIGVADPEHVAQKKEAVTMMRANEKSKKTRALSQISGGLRTMKTKLGTVTLKLFAAKGLPRGSKGVIDFRAAARMYQTDTTTKPDWEAVTDKIRASDPLLPTLKAVTDFEWQIDIFDPLAIVEIELTAYDSREKAEPLGLLRNQVTDLTATMLEGWWMLRLKDGTPKTSQVHIGVQYTEFVETPAEKRARLRAMAEAKAASAVEIAPEWISAWDVRQVMSYSKEANDVRKQIARAVSEGGYEDLEEACRLSVRLSLQLEPLSVECFKLLAEMKELRKEERRIAKEMRKLFSMARGGNPHFLLRECRKVLTQCEESGVGWNEETGEGVEEIVQVLRLMDWADAEIERKQGNKSNKPKDPMELPNVRIVRAQPPPPPQEEAQLV
uniref:Uncharacterized protein n=1 Tax=Hemiselmis andersenii TaxID=464988 RepID=A0A6U4ZNB9_HEMAN|mmetsp:Transcript_8719/g.20395  ORF Transcript_8719/g.20395 Transcript_8719/m.20395 type:complete len:510 (+) Transcript_8719:222-1751(+)